MRLHPLSVDGSWQGRLGRALEEVVEVVSRGFNRGMGRLRHVWFDFHHECRKMRWENLSKLVDLIAPDLDESGTTAHPPATALDNAGPFSQTGLGAGSL